MRNSDITTINLNRWVKGIIDSGKVSSKNPPLDTKPALRAVAGVHSAYTFNPSLCLVTNLEGGYAESSSRSKSAGFAISTVAALSTNWDHVIGVPVGTSVGIGYRQIPEVDDGTTAEVTFILHRFRYTGTEHFSLGTQFSWVFSSIQGVDPRVSMIIAAQDMKFYY